MKISLLLGLVVSLFVLSRCAILPSKVILNNSNDNLTQKDAQLRSLAVDDVHYILSLTLDKTSPKYNGDIKIEFTLSKNNIPLRIDFREGDITQLQVNKKNLLKEQIKGNYNNYFISIPTEMLRLGKNRVVIKFAHEYSSKGFGLHRFVDPKDQRVYLYSDFEPFDAHDMFPCFDQPDIKATYKLNVTVPVGWEVISSTRAQIHMLEDTHRLWDFKKSQKFSTYIFSLHAGPYKVWQDKASKIPSRLFARQSLAKHVNSREWFKITRQGFNFYNKYFGVDYPYKKYDQIIVPDFNSGAMENVAAVTFSEWYVFRSKPTYNQRERRASVILHEMAHMWFGNLVTMKWWNGLWLNESFATFMATSALNKATEFKKSWQSFYNGYKQWAYWTDQLVTTHPIEVAVVDTKTAFSNFDGITYGKGASVLKQLHYFLGAEKFKKGIQHYFKKHAHQNTQLADFFNAMEYSSKRDLTSWVDLWVKRAGLNTVQSSYTCHNGKIESFNLIQSSPQENPYLRKHRTVIALFKLDRNNRLSVIKKLPLAYEKPTTEVPSLIGLTCPDLVFPNYLDEDYVKVTLDPRSLTTVKNSINRVNNVLTRNMLWQTLWDMVRDGNLSLISFVDLAINNIIHEKDYKILSDVVEKLTDESLYYLNRADQNKSIVDQTKMRIEKFFWKNFLAAEPSSDKQKVWFDGLVAVAQSPSALGRLYRLLNGQTTVKGMKIDQDRRWDIVVKLNSFAYKGSQTLIASELKQDSSDRGRKYALMGEVSRPNLEIKKKWFNSIVHNKEKLPLSKIKRVMRAIFPSHQKELHRHFEKSFYTNLDELIKSKGSVYLSNFSRLVPTFCDHDSSTSLQDYLHSNGSKLPPIVSKKLKIGNQENRRCQKIISLMK